MSRVDLAAAYRDGRQRLTALVAPLGAAADRVVPLTPDWRVRDVVAHLLGVAEDFLAGDHPDFSDALARPEQAVTREAWTAAQVARRRDQPLDRVLAEWAGAGARLEAVLANHADDPRFPLTSRVGAPFDLGCHLHDVRHALGAPGDRDAPVTHAAFRIATAWLGQRLASAGLGPLRLATPERSWVLGDGEPVASVTAGAFELFRATTGRRSRAQLLALEWAGDPEPFLDVLAPYPLPDRDVVE